MRAIRAGLEPLCELVEFSILPLSKSSGRHMVNSRGAFVRQDASCRVLQRGHSEDFINQRVPSSSSHPRFEGRQHAFCPNTGIRPHPRGRGFSNRCSREGHSCWFVFRWLVHHTSIFLATLRSVVISDFSATMGPLTSIRLALRARVLGVAEVTAHEHHPEPDGSPCLTSLNLPFVPSPTTCRRPGANVCFLPSGLPRSTVFTASIALAIHGVIWASPSLAGWPRRPAESSSLTTDQTFVSDCSPPPLTRTQLSSTSRLRHYNLGEDLHLADSTRSQAHECGDSSPLSERWRKKAAKAAR